MEDGRATDSQGKTVDFKNAVIIMTSNAGGAAGLDPSRLRADYGSPYFMRTGINAGAGPAGILRTIFVEVTTDGII